MASSLGRCSRIIAVPQLRSLGSARPYRSRTPASARLQSAIPSEVSMRLLGIALGIRSTGAAAVVLLTILLSVSTSAFAQAWIGPAYVTRVAEGNLIYAEVGGRIVAIRYLGVHVPIVDHPTLGREP